MFWIFKALTQAALSVAPFGEEVNYRLQRRASVGSLVAFLDRIEKAITFLETIRGEVDVRNRRILEIGTGWDGLHTVLLAALGAKEIVSFDHVAHLRFMELRKVVIALKPFAMRLAGIYGEPGSVILARLSAWEQERDMAKLLASMKVTYRAPAAASDTGFAESSFDIVYSFLVLQFVGAREVERIAVETRRLLRQGGLSVHHIRMDDPFKTANGGDDLAYLEIPQWQWSLICNNSIQRNNRLRAGRFLELFAGEGTRVVWSRKELNADNLARVGRMKVAAPFRTLAAEDLATTALSIVVRHEKSDAPTQPRNGQRWESAAREAVLG